MNRSFQKPSSPATPLSYVCPLPLVANPYPTSCSCANGLTVMYTRHSNIIYRFVCRSHRYSTNPSAAAKSCPPPQEQIVKYLLTSFYLVPPPLNKLCCTSIRTCIHTPYPPPPPPPSRTTIRLHHFFFKDLNEM